MPRNGFSIMTVMIGAVVVATLGVVYMQMARNKAQISAITNIIAYRDYAFRYYSEIAANRMAWPCTLKANPSLNTYVHSGVGVSTAQPLQLYDVSGTGCVLAGTGERVIPDTPPLPLDFGLGLMLYEPLPATPVNFDSTTHDFRIYTTWEGLGRQAVRVRVASIYNYGRADAITSFKIKEKETYIYMGRTPARNCGESLDHLGFADDGGTGTRAPERYYGDTAVTSVNAQTRLVTCWEQGPLVVPPCFDLQETTDFPNCPSLGTDKLVNYAGMCPENLYFKVPALAGFELDTGQTKCERDYGLILGDRVSNAALHCDSSNPGDAFQGVGSAHYGQCSTTFGRFGIVGSSCPNGHRGWFPNGDAECGGGTVGMQGTMGKPGVPYVLPASPGPPGPAVTCTCT